MTELAECPTRMLTLGFDNCDRDTRAVLEDAVGPKFVCAAVLLSDRDDPAIGDPELLERDSCRPLRANM